MLHVLSNESMQICLKVNIAKTKVMVVDNNPVNVNNVRGKVLKALYTWGNTTASGKITRSGRICLKRQVHNSCVLPAMEYRGDTGVTN